MMHWNQMCLPGYSTKTMKYLTFIHDHAMILLTLIIILVTYAIFVAAKLNPFSYRLLESAEQEETMWSIAPLIILIALGYPAMGLLYLMDDPGSTPELTVKAVGHQWYWSYEYVKWNTPVESDLSFDSFMVPASDLTPNDPRLLTVDKPVVFPMQTPLRLMFSSTDVIHSWTLLGSSIKMDCIEGSENAIFTEFLKPGVFYGNCSELCGALHFAMPIQAEIIPKTEFMQWLRANALLE